MSFLGPALQATWHSLGHPHLSLLALTALQLRCTIVLYFLFFLFIVGYFGLFLVFMLSFCLFFFFCFPPSLLVLTPFPFLCLTLFGALGNGDYICFSFLGCSSAGAIPDIRGKGTSALSNPGEMPLGWAWDPVHKVRSAEGANTNTAPPCAISAALHTGPTCPSSASHLSLSI